MSPSAFSIVCFIYGEAYFTRDGAFNHHNEHLLAVENPHAMRSHGVQNRFSVQFWDGVVGDLLVQQSLVPAPLTSSDYFIFLQKLLPNLIDLLP
ncbi:hypothetical protein TNCT_460711 [Trichonephila clavata]|uniref:Uncharacterized protein n=1 Tax=Trichonephila clavata TaxID=2740835 RepID=A0A8X6H3B5_TRICU|nr:hypothetical protein TNCT_460711 [Trichonephila clavata]